MNAPTTLPILIEFTTMDPQPQFTYPQPPKPWRPITKDEKVRRLSGHVLGMRFSSNEMVVRLDTETGDYIWQRLDENRDTAKAVIGEALLWQRLLRYFSTGARKVEFDLVDVGDRSEPGPVSFDPLDVGEGSDSGQVLFDPVDVGERSNSGPVLFDLGDVGHGSHWGMTVGNVTGVDGIRPSWTASEKEIGVTS